MKKWESNIPSHPKNNDTKRCYTIWSYYTKMKIRAGGKVVWLTDKQLTFARIKHPNMNFCPVLERDRQEYYKRYMNNTIE